MHARLRKWRLILNVGGRMAVRKQLDNRGIWLLLLFICILVILVVFNVIINRGMNDPISILVR